MSSVELDSLANLYDWLDTIPFSRPKKNLARDFSDAALAAELIKHYFPGMVDVHNYPPTNTLRNKQTNWLLLNHKVLKKMNFPLTDATMTELSMAKRGTTEDFLSNLREKINQLLEENLVARKTKKMADTASKKSVYSSSVKVCSDDSRTKLSSVKIVSEGSRTKSSCIISKQSKKMKKYPIEKVKRNQKVMSLPDVSESPKKKLVNHPDSASEIVQRNVYEKKIHDKNKAIQALKAKIQGLEYVLRFKEITIGRQQQLLEKLQRSNESATA